MSIACASNNYIRAESFVSSTAFGVSSASSTLQRSLRDSTTPCRMPLYEAGSVCDVCYSVSRLMTVLSPLATYSIGPLSSPLSSLITRLNPIMRLQQTSHVERLLDGLPTTPGRKPISRGFPELNPRSHRWIMPSYPRRLPVRFTPCGNSLRLGVVLIDSFGQQMSYRPT